MNEIIDEPDTTIAAEEGENDQIKNAERFLEDQGRPSFESLMKLAKKHTAQAAEILQGYAEEYNVNWDPDRSLEDSVHQIWQAMESANADSAN